MPFLSVIIPTLNEAENLPATLDCFRAAGIEEVIVVDGGSEDGTVERAVAGGSRVLTAPEPGRAGQMNLGARESSGEVLLFSHGDTRIPSQTLRNLEFVLKESPELVGGGFARRFESRSCLLRFTAWCSDFRGRWWGLFLGDQGIFVKRSVFEALRGFDEAVVPGEDLDFSYRMAKAGRTCLVGPPVMSSARRFEKRGAFHQTRLDLVAARQILKAAKVRTPA
ncbi:MAG: TIGR04283 family arsenosugar biosynthesis glycosyltransferase [Verrucomicrobiales bacterium]|nr:TIGR04283 family arsenosugar biosynthesis glycosyltransferase [Verrucomicrobiales bacterium]